MDSKLSKGYFLEVTTTVSRLSTCRWIEKTTRYFSMENRIKEIRKMQVLHEYFNTEAQN